MSDMSQEDSLGAARSWYGLRTVFPDPNDTAKVGQAAIDVVAIHGIGADPQWSWNTQGVNWLYHPQMLPACLSNARVMLFGYESNWFGERAVKQRLGNVTELLLRRLNVERKQCRTRPLILIGHCFGGLVAQKAVLAAHTHASKFPDVADSVSGILFLGTPHRGTGPQMSHGLLLAAIEKDTVGRVDGKILEILSPGNDPLVDLIDDFTNVAKEKNLLLSCFFEQQKSDVGRIIKGSLPLEYIVDETSGCLDGYPKCGLARNHFYMNKFSDPDNADYIEIRDEIVRIAHTARKHKQIDNPSYNLGLDLTDVPVIEDESFFGRGSELELLKELLQPNLSNVNQKVVIIRGLGGMGKNQLAVAFAKSSVETFSTILWLNAKSEPLLRQSICKLAARLSLRFETTDEDIAIAAFREWLSRPMNKNRLLVFDNHDEPASYNIKQFFPYQAQGSIVITTRSPRLQIGKSLALKKLDKSHGLQVLARRSGRDKAMEDSDALRLAVRLDGLPLALTTAGDYLHHAPDSFRQYLSNYDKSWQELAEIATELSEYEGRTLYTTWNISLSRIEVEAPEAVAILKFMAFFSNEDIRYELLAKAVNEGVEDSLKRTLTSKLKFNQTMRRLREYSLVESHDSSGAYSLHTCVHDWTLDYLNPIIEPTLVWTAFRCVASSRLDDDCPQSIFENRRLFEHALRVNHTRISKVVEESGTHSRYEDFESVALLFREYGRFIEAEQMFQRALAGQEKVFGPDHKSTLQVVNNLGISYKAQGKYAEAERMYQRALEGKEKALGSNHISTLQAVHNLGALYLDLGKHAEAEHMYQRALAGQQKALGPDHTSALRTASNLGTLYKHQGKYIEAKQMYQQALAGKERILGPDHTSTLQTIHNFGVLYENQGKHAEAEQMYQQALRGRERVLGPNHTSTLDTVEDLASLYYSQKEHEKAEEMFQRALASKEETVGRDHASTLETCRFLYCLYSDQGKLREAEEMCQRVIAGSQTLTAATIRDQVQIELLKRSWNVCRAGGFSLSTDHIRIQSSRFLVGSAMNHKVQPLEASLDLDTCIHIANGKLQWGNRGDETQSFAGAARNPSLRPGFAGRLSVLHAEVSNGPGNWQDAELELDERISNRDGVLIYETS